MKIQKLLLTAYLLVVSYGAFSDPGISVIKIGNGITKVDFVGNGVPDLIISGHRENFNAHSFEVVSFYIPVENNWNIVPIFENDKEKLQITVSGGADCLLHDFRLIKSDPKKSATLIIADREMGDSYADQATVVFTYYTLVRREEVGSPHYGFEKSRTQTAAVKYCDVGEAFKNELSIGTR